MTKITLHNPLINMLKIQNYSPFIYKIQKKNDVKNSTSPSFRPQNQPLSKISLNHLNSKFNINFTSAQVELKKLTQNYEKKIKEVESIPEANSNVAITSPEDLEILTKVFQNNDIIDIAQTKLSLNSALKYLIEKEQVRKLGFGNSTAFMIDKMSLQDTQSIEMALKTPRIKFFSYVRDEKEAKELEKEFRKITKRDDVELKVIQKPQNQKSLKKITTEELVNIIKKVAENKFPNNKSKQEQYIEVISKYLNQCLNIFSYNSIAQNLEKLYSKIEQEVQNYGKTMDDVLYIVPDCAGRAQSFSLINYIYAAQNNINPNQFITLEEAKQTEDIEKIYVLVDDICVTADTFDKLERDIRNYKTKGFYKKLILAPMLISEARKENLKEYFKEGHNPFDTKLVYSDTFEDLQVLNTPKDKKYDPKTGQLLVKNEYTDLKNLSAEDIAYMLAYMKGGHGRSYCGVVFPYMIPDNSCEILRPIGKYFLNIDSGKANKAPYGCKL